MCSRVQDFISVQEWVPHAGHSNKQAVGSALQGGEQSTGQGTDMPATEASHQPCASHSFCFAQGYGDNQAFGGGIQGGDQFTGQGTDMQRRAQKQTSGGDQTNLDAGGDTNFGVSFFAIAHLEIGMCVPHLAAFTLSCLLI